MMTSLMMMVMIGDAGADDDDDDDDDDDNDVDDAKLLASSLAFTTVLDVSRGLATS